MPVRLRADSSPRSSDHNGHKHGEDTFLTSKESKESEAKDDKLHGGKALPGRGRRDTTTSSELSSESENDPPADIANFPNPQRAVRASRILSVRLKEGEEIVDSPYEKGNYKQEASSVAGSTLSSEFSDMGEPNSLLEHVGDSMVLPAARSPKSQFPSNSRDNSPQKSRQTPLLAQDLPPPRPISIVKPISILSQAIKAKKKKPASPIDRFAPLSGKGNPNPLYIKMYAPFSSQPRKPYEVLLHRATNDGEDVTVAQAIGFSLWFFVQEGIRPEFKAEQLNPNKWTLRIVEDEEVDYDFPPLGRVSPIADFTSNNNRAASRRTREKPWDEFAIVEGTAEQFQENEKVTPELSSSTAETGELDANEASELLSQQPSIFGARVDSIAAPYNPITGPGFAPALTRKDSTVPLDVPTAPVSHATPRLGASKMLTIHYVDNDFNSQKITITVTTDTYIGEVFDQVCKKLNMDKGSFVLKVAGTATIAPSDRTVEALGGHHVLDLARRRFVGDKAYGVSGSPGSSSPNAPLLISAVSTPRKNKRGPQMHSSSQRPEMVSALSTFSSANSKRYVVNRKQPMSFNSSSSRILAIEDDYIHIMPYENPGGAKALFDSTPKTVTAHFSSVVASQVSRRHLKNFRVMIYRERETKRYDFEAVNESEAHEIVGEIQHGMEKFQYMTA